MSDGGRARSGTQRGSMFCACQSPGGCQVASGEWLIRSFGGRTFERTRPGAGVSRQGICRSRTGLRGCHAGFRAVLSTAVWSQTRGGSIATDRAPASPPSRRPVTPRAAPPAQTLRTGRCGLASDLEPARLPKTICAREAATQTACSLGYSQSARRTPAGSAPTTSSTVAATPTGRPTVALAQKEFTRTNTLAAHDSSLDRHSDDHRQLYSTVFRIAALRSGCACHRRDGRIRLAGPCYLPICSS